MDVTCPRCATEYEFDETLVSDRGTTVKCTNCGHLFKVYPPGAQPGGGERSWVVRRKDGSEEELGSLKELQQRITQGDVDETDDISRSGEDWKRLGDIAELQTFFRAAHAARSASSAPAPAPKPRSVAPPPPTSPSTAPKKRTLVGFGAASPSAPPPRAPVPPPPSAPRPPPTTSAPPPKPPPRPPGSSVRPEPRVTARPPRPEQRVSIKTEVEAPPSPSLPERPPSGRVPLQGESSQPRTAAARQRLYLDEEEHQAIPKRKPRYGLWITLLILVAGGAGVALGWDTISEKLGLGAESPALAFLDAGDASLAKDTEEGYADAIREYTRASAHDQGDPRTLASLSTAHSAWAQSLSFRANDLEARAGANPALSGEAASLLRDATRHANDAKRNAEELLRMHPADPRGELVLADALRLDGDLSGAQSHLDRAQEMFANPPPQFHLVRALLAMGGEHDVAAAAPAASAAVAADGDLLRARLVLARAKLATGDVAGARLQLDAVTRAVDGHDGAQHLLDAIEQGLPPAAPVVAMEDAGLDGAMDAGVVAPPPTMQGTMQGATMAGATMRTEGGGVPSGRDYSWYIQQGDRARNSGDLDIARQHFEAAERLRPGSVEAMTGLGQIALRQGNFAEAARRFRPAVNADYGDAYIGLANAYQRMGNDEQAITTYRGYLNSRPNGPHATLARRRIEALEAESMQPTMSPEPTMEATMEPEPTEPTMEAEGPSEPPPAPEPDSIN